MPTVTKPEDTEIVGELGRGAMGVVLQTMGSSDRAYRPVKTSVERTRHGALAPELLSRFQTEARAAGLLDASKHRCRIRPGEEDGLYYITMELVEGKSLRRCSMAALRFPARTLRIMEQTCSALQFAHERTSSTATSSRRTHVTARRYRKVTDFGTAKILQFGTGQQTAHVMGTPSYMSPEQGKGRAVDGRSDIFSRVSCSMKWGTGEKPFPGQNITTVIYKIVKRSSRPAATD